MINRIFTGLQNLLLSQVIVIFLVGAMFFGMQSFDYGESILLAQVDTVTTPEGIYYKGTPDNQGDVKNAREKLKATGEQVRDKLNLNQDTPAATKEFFKSIQEKVDETVEPITGTKGGYYQEIPPQREAEK